MTKQPHNVWQWLIEPSNAITDPEKRRRARLFSLFLLIPICLISIFLIVMLTLTGLGVIQQDPDMDFPSIRGAAVILGFAVALYIVSRTRYNAFSIMLTVTLMIVRILSAALTGQLHLHYLFAPILIVLFFSLVSSVGMTAIIASLGLCLLVGIGLFAPGDTIEIALPMTFVHIVASAFVLIGVGHRDQQRRRIQQQARELQKQNEALLQANKELAVAWEKAKESNRLKNQFLTTMSHELRTPLHAIMGYSQILLEGFSGSLNPQQHQSQERIFENALALIGLVDHILEITQIEAARMAMEPTPFTLSDWVHDITGQTQSQAEEKGLAFQVVIDQDMPDSLVGDVRNLKQVVVNLLDNAVKFTKEGSVKLAIRRQGDQEWSIAVSDTGVGIPPGAHEYIFEEFRQVDGSIKREYGGVGLGLAIVRNLVKIMDGRIEVESEVDQGSTFTVTLPLITEESAAGAVPGDLIGSQQEDITPG
jgi:signal transduction histidine kinase